MKKFFSTALAVFMMAIMPVMAQNNNNVNEAVTVQNSEDNPYCNNEVSVSVGCGNVIQFYTAIFGAMLGQDNAGEYVINADYSHRLGRKVSVGATFNYFEAEKSTETLASKYYTVMPHIKVDYMHNNWVTLYGKAAIGIMINDYKHVSDNKVKRETNVYGSFQISPFGIEAGPNKHLRIFSEVGLGMSGFAQAGLRYKF